MRARPLGGFTLVELVIVIVAVAIFAALMTSPLTTLLGSVTHEDTIRRTNQLAAECADQALGFRRKPGSYAGLVIGTYTADEANNPCRSSRLALDTGATRTVTICDARSTGSCPEASCSTGWNCKRVQIAVAKSGYTARLEYMAIEY